MLLLFWCLLEGAIKGEKLSFVRYMECEPPFNEVDDAQSCMSLQLANAGSANDKKNVTTKGADESSLAAGEWFGALEFKKF